MACRFSFASLFFFFNDTATTEIYTLSLHDALPIYWRQKRSDARQTVPGDQAVEPDQQHASRCQADRVAQPLSHNHEQKGERVKLQRPAGVVKSIGSKSSHPTADAQWAAQSDERELE